MSPVHSAVAKATKLHNTNMALWGSQSGQTHPAVSVSLVLEKGAAWELLCVNIGFGWVSFSLLSTEDRVFGTSQQKVQTSRSLGLCAVHCSNLYFLWENYPIFCKLYINEDHLYQILFPLFQNTYSAFIQLLPVLVIVIISVITQLLAANPPYSLFYKS